MSANERLTFYAPVVELEYTASLRLVLSESSTSGVGTPPNIGGTTMARSVTTKEGRNSLSRRTKLR